ncbi:MAG: hypothetical protein Q7K42_01105 [Candidatus Diapherotrites archaeon]|nr:hypothetical protein [Candidatus Diapherotrites archaeon]
MEHLKRKCGFCNSENTEILKKFRDKNFTLKCLSCGQSYEIYSIHPKHH